jgi:hypothetical protein
MLRPVSVVTPPPNAAPPDQAESRSAARRDASLFPSITGLRIKPGGADAVLINISESGLLAECSERMKTGSVVTVIFLGGFTPPQLEGRVARHCVASMGKDGRLRYHVGIQFVSSIVLDVPPPAPPEPAAAVNAAAAEAPAAAPVAEAAPVAPVATVVSVAPPTAVAIEIPIELPNEAPAPPVIRNRW